VVSGRAICSAIGMRHFPDYQGFALVIVGVWGDRECKPTLSSPFSSHVMVYSCFGKSIDACSFLGNCGVIYFPWQSHLTPSWIHWILLSVSTRARSALGSDVGLARKLPTEILPPVISYKIAVLSALRADSTAFKNLT
jgi:hypothetical protein